VGLDHFEGRSYVGLMRHMILCQLIILFLAEQTARLNAQIATPAALPAAAAPGKKNGPPRRRREHPDALAAANR